MKNAILFGLLGLVALPTLAEARTPRRRAIEVLSVGRGYTVGNKWIISPTEERRNDQLVSNAPECDLRAISAANDRKRLRIDIWLHNPVNYRKQIIYAFKVKLLGNIEHWYAYTPHNKRFTWYRFQGDRLTKKKNLFKRSRSDWVEIGSTTRGGRNIPNSRVTLYIDKDKHFSMTGKGRRKFFTAQFFSGYFQRGSGKLKQADATIVVQLSYKR